MASRRAIESAWPLSPLQEGLLFHSLYDRKTTDVYTVQAVLEITGELRAPVLRNSVRALLARYSSLRAGFLYRRSGAAVQAIARRAEPRWTQLDLRDLDVDRRAAELARLIADDRARRFDMAAPPLVRCALLHIEDLKHVLVFTCHHILLDGWSLSIVLDDLIALYESGGSDRGRPPETPFHTYLEWLASRDRAASEAVWRATLSGLREPTLVASGDRTTLLPARVVVTLPAELTSALPETARKLGLTVNTLVQGAWAILLSHMTGRRDVVFGVTVSGRPAELVGVEHMVGLLMNTVPVRVVLDPAEPLAGMLARLQDEQSALAPHQYLGLADIQRLTRLGTLFDTSMVFQNETMRSGTSTADVNFVRVGRTDPVGEMHYPLSLVVSPGARLELQLNYRRDFFAESAIRTWGDRLRRLLATLVAHPDRPVGQVDVLTGPQRHRLLQRSIGAARDVGAATLPERFAAQAARTPRATAVVFRNESVTYAELDARVERLARLLAGLGVAAESVVGVALPRSVELVVALLAVHRAGAAYLPLDLEYPAARLAHMLQDAAPACVLTAANAHLPDFGVHRILVDALDEAAPTGPLPTSYDVALPAYVMYTSGSTGRPKGVIVTQAGITNRLSWMQDEYGLVPDDRVLQKTPSSFDVSVWEFHWPLITGATLVVAKPDGHRDPEYLAALIQAKHVTTAHFVPAMLEAFLTEPLCANCTSLRLVLCSGERLPVRLANRCHDVLAARLDNLYGPTEASVDATSTRLLPGAPTAPIGSPVWNTRTYVLDTELRLAPDGVTGELYLAGIQLARGYLGRPGLTAERFVADPWGPPGARMYRTGDLARWEQGGLEFVGRTDDQIKIRGMRVEPAEIENVLADHESVARAAVALARQRLVGYVVAADGQVPNLEALRATCREVLPAHMVPTSVIEVDALPLGPSGKLDRSALPVSAPTTTVPGRAPRTAEETLLVRIFAEVLEVDDLGIDDNFFDLGGHSVLATRAISRIRSSTRTNLNIRDLFEAPTVAELADRLASSDTADALGVLLPLRAAGDQPALFCVHPGYGISWSYIGLAPHLTTPRPIYGLQARSLRHDSALPASVEQMADDYVAEIRTVAPTGPYHLLGWSFGGLVAHAMAVRLQELGEHVGLLALLDTYPASAWHGVGSVEDADSVAARVRRELKELKPHEVAAAVRTYTRNARMATSFTPGRFDGDMTFCTAGLGRADDAPTARTWRHHVTGRIDDTVISCPHDGMMRPEAAARVGGVVQSMLG